MYRETGDFEKQPRRVMPLATGRERREMSSPSENAERREVREVENSRQDGPCARRRAAVDDNRERDMADRIQD